MDADLASYKELYLDAARSCIDEIRKEISALSVNPTAESVENLFIKSHSLKGQSMTMGHSGIAKAALAIERYMRSKKETDTFPDRDSLPVVQSAIDKIAASLDAIEKVGRELPMSGVITDLELQLKVKI